MVKAQAVDIACKCTSCGSVARCYYTQFFRDGELGWERERSCQGCGCSEAIYHLGRPPEEIRQLIIERYGAWGIRVGDQVSIPFTLKVLKQGLKFSNDELKATIGRVPGIILRGTNVEMEWSAYHLHRGRVECEVVADKAS